MDNLNARQFELVKFLLNIRRSTAGELAKKVGVSEKTIYSDLQVIKSVLQRYGVTIEKQPRIGITVKGRSEDPQSVINEISKEHALPDSDQDRVTYILTRLLKLNNYITVEHLAQELFISSKTIERNLHQLELQVADYGVTLDRHPKRGIRLIASETQKRKILFQILNSFWGDRWVIKHGKSGQVMSYQQITDSSLISSKLAGQLIEIVSKFAEEQEIKISDYAFQSLVIHLAIAVQIVQDGNAISKSLQGFEKLGDLQRNNAIILAKLIQERLKVSLPDKEISYIQLHLIAATSGGINLALRSTKSPVKERLKILLRDFGMDEELLTGLALHLESALKRLQVGATISNPYTGTIKQNYTQAFDEALKISKSYEQHEKIKMNDDEVAYLAIYLEAFLERQRTDVNRLRVAIVCSTGLGSAQLLAAKVRKEFPNLKINGVWSVQDLQHNSLDNIDLIISTIQIKIANIPTVMVSPLLEDGELKSIENIVNKSKASQKNLKSEFKKMITQKLVFANKSFENWQDAVRFIGNHLISNGYATSGVIESAIQREDLSYTSFGSYAVPHANPDLVQKPAIAVCTLKKPVSWGKEKVSIVFFIAMTKSLGQEQIDNIFDEFYELVSNKRSLERLIDSSSDDELLNKLNDKER